MIVKLDGTSIKDPTGFTVSRFKLTKAGRMGNGLRTMDFVASKKRFEFNYKILDGEELNTIETILYDDETLFFTLTYPDNQGVEQTATVYAGAISYDKFRTETNYGYYWKNIAFNLIEQ